MTWLPILRTRRDLGFGSLRDQMDRFFGTFAEDWTRSTLASTENGAWSPAIDIHETDKDYVVRAEVPGLDASDIDISLKEDVLTLRGGKSENKEEKDEHYHYVESRHGVFQRTFRLPQNVDADKVKAECSKGVLSVHIPKVPEAEPKKIEIKSS